MNHCGSAFRSAWLFSVIVLWTAGAKAGGFEEWIGRATHLAVVSVTSGAAVEQAPHRACSYTYRLRIERNFRGLTPQVIYTDAGLKIGGRYLLIYAEATPWATREFSTDVPLLPSEAKRPDACDKLRNKAVLIRSAELRPLRQAAGQLPSTPDARFVISPRSEWVEFPPLVFSNTSPLTHVSDLDRIEVINNQLAWPELYLYEYVLLPELIDYVHKVRGELR